MSERKIPRRGMLRGRAAETARAVGIPVGETFSYDFPDKSRVTLELRESGVEYCYAGGDYQRIVEYAWNIWVLGWFGVINNLGVFSKPVPEAESVQVLLFMDLARSEEYRRLRPGEVIPRFLADMAKFWKDFLPASIGPGRVQ